jgi:transposase-like protein
MVRGQRKQYSGDIKARAVLEAIRGLKTVNEIGVELGVHPTQITKWKKQALQELPQMFSRRREAAAQDEETLKARLYQEIGQLKVELDWLKKKLWDGGSIKNGR